MALWAKKAVLTGFCDMGLTDSRRLLSCVLQGAYAIGTGLDWGLPGLILSFDVIACCPRTFIKGHIEGPMGTGN